MRKSKLENIGFGDVDDFESGLKRTSFDKAKFFYNVLPGENDDFVLDYECVVYNGYFSVLHHGLKVHGYNTPEEALGEANKRKERFEDAVKSKSALLGSNIEFNFLETKEMPYSSK